MTKRKVSRMMERIANSIGRLLFAHTRHKSESRKMTTNKSSPNKFGDDKGRADKNKIAEKHIRK